MSKAPDPSINVIFGGTGDLARRKLLPALARLVKGGHLHPRCHLFAVATEALDDEGYRKLAREALAAAGFSAEEIALFINDQVHYQCIGKGAPEDFAALAKRLAE